MNRSSSIHRLACVTATVTILSSCVANVYAQGYVCPGICNDPNTSDELINPGVLVQIDGFTATCSQFDKNMQLLTDAEACFSNGLIAEQAGCNCGTPQECPGVCPAGDTLLNPTAMVNAGGITANCELFDENTKQQADPAVCAGNAQLVREAGCQCGIPIDCPGICPPDEQLLNKGTFVDVGGLKANCGLFDAENAKIVDADKCFSNAQLAQEAGCKCGVPIQCLGVCWDDPTKELTNPLELVELNGSILSCDLLDIDYKSEIDLEVCNANGAAAQAAGCRCGTLTECSGICAEGEELVNGIDFVSIGGRDASCEQFNVENQAEIDADMCAANAQAAKDAGCECWESMPDMEVSREDGGDNGDSTSAGSHLSTSQIFARVMLGLLGILALSSYLCYDI